MRERRNVVLTPRVWWAHEAWGNLGKVSSVLWPPAAVSCRQLSMSPAPLSAQDIAPPSQTSAAFLATLQKYCGEIHRILIIVSSWEISWDSSKWSVFYHGALIVQCRIGAPWPAGRYPLLWIPETSLSHETWQQQNIDRLRNKYSEDILTANFNKRILFWYLFC